MGAGEGDRAGWVIGCVHGAWRTLQDGGDADVTYEWCEAAWDAYGLGRLLGPPPIDPALLVSHLRVFRANGWVPPADRPPPVPDPPRPAQMALPGLG